MLQEVALGQKSLADYTHIAGRGLIEQIRELAEPLKGKSVLHVSATAFGGGVSEILYTLVPLMRDVGLDAHWQVILGREEFFNVTKLMHNSLQGDPESIADQQWEVFEAYNAMNAQDLEGEWDVIIVHDPQPAGLRDNGARAARHWIWRCHIDLSTPNPSTLARLEPLITGYDASVWHLRAVRAGRPRRRHPQDLSARDRPAVAEEHGALARRRRLRLRAVRDRHRPPADLPGLALRPVEGPDRRDRRLSERQASRSPDAQLALVGSMATDDPEGWEFFHRTFRHADGDPDIKILNNLNNVGAIEVNAFQSQADVCMQKSIREGFGLTVTEALWKGRPTIGGDVGGIPLQIDDGVSGFLVASPEEAAQRTIEILEDPELAKRLGRAGKEHAREHFLTPRLLRDWLDLFTELEI